MIEFGCLDVEKLIEDGLLILEKESEKKQIGLAKAITKVGYKHGLLDDIRKLVIFETKTDGSYKLIV